MSDAAVLIQGIVIGASIVVFTAALTLRFRDLLEERFRQNYREAASLDAAVQHDKHVYAQLRQKDHPRDTLD